MKCNSAFDRFYLILVPVLLSIFILLAPFPYNLKPVFAIIMFIFYHRTLTLLFTLGGNVRNFICNYPVDSRDDDTIIRKNISCTMYKYFRYTNNFDKIPNHPTIFVANYVSDRLENITCILIPTKLCIIMGEIFIKTVKLHKIVKHVCGTFKSSKGNYENVKKESEKHLKNGVSMFCYIIDPTAPISDRIGKVRSGMFKIAKEIGSTITPIYFDHIEHNHGIIPYQRYTIVVGDTFHVDDVEQDMFTVKKFFKDTRKELKLNKYDTC